MSIYSREDSNQFSTPKESDDFIMVDLGEIVSVFYTEIYGGHISCLHVHTSLFGEP